jgi:hypothetical protein
LRGRVLAFGVLTPLNFTINAVLKPYGKSVPA